MKRCRYGFNVALKVCVVTGVLGALSQCVQLARAATSDLDASKFVAAAERYEGKKVGDGQCATFVSQVIKDMKGQPLVQRAKTSAERAKEKEGYKLPDQIYVWGDVPAKVKGKNGKLVAPGYKAGEILQFENCYFEKRRADGSLQQNWDFPHHTAIIKSVKGSVVTLLQQNAPLGSKVHDEDVLDLSLLTPKDGVKGTLTVFLPKKK
jgi:hypothetical protein